MPTYTNSHAKFDCALDGVPFFLGPTSEFPYVRQSAEFRRQQIDSTNEPGEQSLTSWWYRSQSTFHLGAGSQYFDPIRGDITSQARFWDSSGVDVWTKGRVSLLRKATLKDATATWGQMVSWAKDADSGLLYEDGNDVRCYKVSTNSSFVVGYEGGSAGTEAVWDVDASGEKYFVLANSGLYRGALPGAGGGKIYNIPGGDDRGLVRWVKERLYACVSNRLYELNPAPDTPPKALPADYAGTADGRLLFTHPEDDWKWTGIAQGPDAVFFSGYAGNSTQIHGGKSVIFASTMEVANIDDPPQTTVPTVVAEMPNGEYILSMCSYLGTYLVVTTTKGVRVCGIGDGGQLQVGPLSIAGFVYHACVWDRFVYTTGALVDGSMGLYRMDLSAPVDDSGLRFAWAKDVASTVAPVGGYTARVAMVGSTGRLAFMVKNSGLWLEHATDLVSGGWLQTGSIRMDTWTDKVFQLLRTVFDPTSSGTVIPQWVDEAGTQTALWVPVNVSGTSKVDLLGSDGQPRMAVSYRWVLTPSGPTSGPVLLGYQSRSLPANVRQREIRLPLLCYRKERTKAGRTVTRPVWDRVEAVEAAERSGKVVTFQDFNTGETRQVTVESVQFVTDRPAQSQVDASEPGGMLMVTLRTAD